MLQQPFYTDGAWITDRWHFDGIQAVVLENAHIRVVILPGKGADIIEFRHKASDTNYLLSQPGGLRNPQKTTPSAYGDTPFLDFFTGGWNDVLPNGGPGVVYQGAALGQHGEASLLAWDYAIVEQRPEQVSVKLWVSLLRTPFRVEKQLTLKADSSTLQLDLSVQNNAGKTLHCMWGQHIAFGASFLQQGGRIHAPDCQIKVHSAIPGFEPRRFKPDAEGQWPQIEQMDGSTGDASFIPAVDTVQAQEMAYLLELTDGWYAITNPETRVGFGLRFDHAVFKYLWYWQQLGQAAEGYPWWSRTHTAALEPWTSYPTNGLLEAIENGTALQLEPGETVSTRMQAIAFSGISSIESISVDGDIQGN